MNDAQDRMDEAWAGAVRNDATYLEARAEGKEKKASMADKLVNKKLDICAEAEREGATIPE